MVGLSNREAKMLYYVKETNGRYYNAYGQRISKSVALMLMDCNAAYRVACR